MNPSRRRTTPVRARDKPAASPQRAQKRQEARAQEGRARGSWREPRNEHDPEKTEWPQKSTKGTKENRSRKSSDHFCFGFLLCLLCFFVAIPLLSFLTASPAWRGCRRWV